MKCCFSLADIRPQGYKTFFMLNSVEHEILNAHRYKNIKKLCVCVGGGGGGVSSPEPKAPGELIV